MFRKYVIFLLVILVLISPAKATYVSWAESSGIFTVGKSYRVNIYVMNVDDPGENTYDVSVDKICATKTYQCDSSHLIRISLQSNKIVGLEPDESGYTIATVTSLGPFNNVYIDFNVGPNPETVRVDFISAEPVSMPEFGLGGIIALIVLAPLILVISNRFFLRF